LGATWTAIIVDLTNDTLPACGVPFLFLPVRHPQPNERIGAQGPERSLKTAGRTNPQSLVIFLLVAAAGIAAG